MKVTKVNDVKFANKVLHIFLFSRFFITEDTWQYTVSVEDCRFINITDNTDNTTSSNGTEEEPIPPCPLIFAVRSSGLADVDGSSYVKDCSKVSKLDVFFFFFSR